MKQSFQEFYDKLKLRNVERQRVELYRESKLEPYAGPKWINPAPELPPDTPLKEKSGFGNELEDEEING